MKKAEQGSTAGDPAEESLADDTAWQLAERVYTSELGDGLFPFRDLNDVSRISAGSDGIEFHSANGIGILSRNGHWSCDVLPQEHPSLYAHRLEGSLLPKYLDLELPAWYREWKYTTPTAQYWLGDDEFIMVLNSDGGAVCLATDIIDVAGGKVYRLEAYKAGALYVDAADIWVGHARGLIRIDRETGRRTNIYTLPRFTEIRGVAEHAGVKYIATGDALLAVDAAGGVDQLDIQVGIIGLKRSGQDRTSNRSKAFGILDNSYQSMRYINPVIWEGPLYIGIVIADRSLLLSYDPATGTWSRYELSDHFGLYRLELQAGRLWCFGHMYEWYEGGGYSSWGGLAVLDKSGNLIQAPALEGVPIGAYRFEADSLAVSTDKYYEQDVAWWQPGVHEPSEVADTNYICRLSMDYRIVKREAFQVVGKARRFCTQDGENLKRIPEFWREGNEDGTWERLRAHGKASSCLGICFDMEYDKGQFTYMIAVESDRAPEGEEFAARTIPALTWAVFTSVGPLPAAIQEVTRRIYQEWFPATGYEHEGTAEMEVYPPGDSRAADYRCEVWIPIKKK